MLGQRKHPGLDLSLAIRAQKDALLCLLAKGVDRASEPAATEPEPLLAGVDVMEVKGARIRVETAEDAAAARLLHEDALRAPPPVRHRVCPAP